MRPADNACRVAWASCASRTGAAATSITVLWARKLTKCYAERDGSGDAHASICGWGQNLPASALESALKGGIYSHEKNHTSTPNRSPNGIGADSSPANPARPVPPCAAGARGRMIEITMRQPVSVPEANQLWKPRANSASKRRDLFLESLTAGQTSARFCGSKRKAEPSDVSTPNLARGSRMVLSFGTERRPSMVI